MKTISTLFIALLVSFSALAGFDDSKLSITIAGNRSVRILVDDRNYNNQDNSITISNLAPGHHTVKIYYAGNNNRNYNGRRGYGNNMQLLYSSQVYIKPRHHVDIIINRFGKALVDEQAISQNRNGNDWDDDDYYDRDPRNGRDDYYNRPMNDHSFNAMKETLRRESFDNSRMSMAKQIIDRNYFTTEQVKQLMQFFSFDDKKLEIAKHAYRNTVDKGNYFILYDVFSFSHAKEQLAAYIRSYR